MSRAQPLHGPEDPKHHTLIHDRSMASESAFPTWRTWLQADGDPGIAAFKNWIYTKAKTSVADVACWHFCMDRPCVASRI